MLPLLLMGAGASLLSGFSSANAANKTAAQNYMDQLEQVRAANKDIQEANLQNTIRTGYRVGILNVQRGSQKAEAVKQGYTISQKYQQVMGSNAANAAASGNVGSSLDVVEGDIARKAEEAKLAVEDQYQISSFNFETQLNDLVQAGQDSLRSVVKTPKGPKYTNAYASGLSSLTGAAIQFGTTYAMSKMSLGLGATPGAQNVTPVPTK